MNEGNTSNPDPEVSSTETATADQSAETTSSKETDQSTNDVSAMARAIKHELENKGMTVEVEDDGETLTATKLDQSYQINPDGTIEGSGTLKDLLQTVVDDLHDNQSSDNEQEADGSAVNGESESPSSTEDSNETSSQDGSVDSTSSEGAVENGSNAETDGNTSEKSEPSTSNPPANSTSDSGINETDEMDETDETDEEDETAVNNDVGDEPETVEDDAAKDDEVESEETEAEAEEEETEEEESLPTGHPHQFEASIEAGRLQKSLDAVNAVVDECKIHLTTDELIIRAVDPANVLMVDETVSVDAFETYQASSGVIGTNLERLIEVVNMADNDDDLIQFENNSETRKLEIQVNSVEYTLALIDPESIRQEPDIPDLDLPANIAIDQDEIQRAVRAADMVSDHIKLGVNKRDEYFFAEAEGDTDDVGIELGRDDLVEATFASADSLFSLEYLKDIRKPIPKDTTVHMELGEEFPIKLKFEMVDGDAEVEFMLAPRIKS